MPSFASGRIRFGSDINPRLQRNQTEMAGKTRLLVDLIQQPWRRRACVVHPEHCPIAEMIGPERGPISTRLKPAIEVSL
jgi:hypothetical protein